MHFCLVSGSVADLVLIYTEMGPSFLLLYIEPSFSVISLSIDVILEHEYWLFFGHLFDMQNGSVSTEYAACFTIQ